MVLITAVLLTELSKIRHYITYFFFIVYNKERLVSSNLKNINTTDLKVLFLDVDIDNVLVFNKISFCKKAINTKLVTYMMIIKLSHYKSALILKKVSIENLSAIKYF